MKIEFDRRDIELIAQKVAEYLKPLINEVTPAGDEDELFSVEEAALFLKTTKGQIYQWVNNSQHGLGDFPFLKAGRLLRFSKSSLMEWLNSSKFLTKS